MSTTTTVDPYQELANVFEVLGDRVRLRILKGIALGSLNVGELCTLTGKRQQAVSHHLTIMRLRRLVEFVRTGKTNRYRPTEAGLRALAMVETYARSA